MSFLAADGNHIMIKVDIIIIGAGAAGLMCAIEAGKRKRSVLILEHTNKPGKKILVSGGGRCNFTNYFVESDKFISQNPHFCKSALSRYTQWDFIALVDKYKIPYHEKALGQLFCDNKSKDIVKLLLAECEKYSVTIKLNSHIKNTKKTRLGFSVTTNNSTLNCESLVVATGGLSMPTMGASPFGYKIAEQFGIKIWPTRAGLVPFTLHDHDKEIFSPLSGVSANSIVSNSRTSFPENILFTHRGLSGPGILQISSYWQPGEAIEINLLPDAKLHDLLIKSQHQHPKMNLKNTMHHYLPKRIIETMLDRTLADQPLYKLSQQQLKDTATQFQHWQIKPNGTEGYRTAEVTLGGVDCDAMSSKTMQANDIPGLYFIGEVLDVTGWLGGYNFQWAWSSGWAAGQEV